MLFRKKMHFYEKKYKDCKVVTKKMTIFAFDIVILSL